MHSWVDAIEKVRVEKGDEEAEKLRTALFVMLIRSAVTSEVHSVFDQRRAAELQKAVHERRDQQASTLEELSKLGHQVEPRWITEFSRGFLEKHPQAYTQFRHTSVALSDAIGKFLSEFAEEKVAKNADEVD